MDMAGDLETTRKIQVREREKRAAMLRKSRARFGMFRLGHPPLHELARVAASLCDIDRDASRLVEGVEVTIKSGPYEGRLARCTSAVIGTDGRSALVQVEIHRVKGRSGFVRPRSRRDGRVLYPTSELEEVP